ncbi:MAG: hypothetical protein ABEJ60_02465 [Halodesulfurarchaeum sp.]
MASPLASESPELLVTAYLVRKAQETAAFNALISSKLNQWTLLVGTLVVVYSVASGQYAPLPFDPHQTRAIWLTAAQSFFAVSLLVTDQVSGREAIALFGLFALTLLPVFPIHVNSTLAFTAIYLLLGFGLFLHRRGAVVGLLGDARDVIVDG